MPTKEFSEPVLEEPPELTPSQIERVAELTEFSRERVKTVLEVCPRAGLGTDMRDAITTDLAMILCALHGLSRTRITDASRSHVPF